ncbi:ribokinase [Bacillus gobiensis]|uniref:ribokinase n=1 Tax=Bacillus gobiensis TaxID=1441095 RepID=UPI003D1E9F24
MTTICVIGSVSMDLVVTTDIRPGVGETVLGNSFQTVPGGKGANQAVAASRLGADVFMLGITGNDSYGEIILKNLENNGVHTDYMEKADNTKSGTAHIILSEGDNSIIVVKGANDHVTPDYVRGATEILQKADIVLIQQEIPEATVQYTIDHCEKLKIPVLLNPAPARQVAKEIIEKATYLTPNEYEASVLLDGRTEEEALKAHPNKLLITKGKNGVRYHNGIEEKQVPSFPVKAVDSTGAGDTFNAALAIALAEKMKMEDALLFANRAASLSVLKFGAQGGMPTRAEVDSALRQ